MKTMSPAELWKELDSLASLAVDRLVSASAEDRLRLLFRYSAKSQLCILLAALRLLKEARCRTVALNARIGTLEWAHRVELEIMHKESALTKEEPASPGTTVPIQPPLQPSPTIRPAPGAR